MARVDRRLRSDSTTDDGAYEGRPEQISGLTESKWKEVFSQYTHQIQLVMITDTKFGDDYEVLFHFRNRPLRWINGTGDLAAVLIVPMAKDENVNVGREVGLRFLSYLSYETEMSFSTLFALGSTIHFRPVRQPRVLSGTKYSGNYRLRLDSVPDQRVDKAMALYREAISSSSVYYKFLSFYKVIQLAFEERGEEIKEWINSTVASPAFNLKDWLSFTQISLDQCADYLWRSGRCAIAHVSVEPIVDPDDPRDHDRIVHDLSLVRSLARRAIKERILRA